MSRVPRTGDDRKASALRLLREAGELGDVCNSYWGDLSRCVELEEEVSFAVDVDVVVLYTDPAQMSVYGRVLSDSTEEGYTAAALLLGDYIVRRMPALLSATAPAESSASVGLMLIPPHDAELRRVGLAISQASMDGRQQLGALKPSSSQVELLQRYLNNGHAATSDSTEEVVELLVKTGLLADPYKDGGSKLELARLDALGVGRFIGPRDHPWFQGKGVEMLPPRRPAINNSGSNHASYRELESIADVWHKRLVSIYLQRFGSGHVSRRPKNVLSDALVLARLQWMNERLAAAPDKMRRLVLITGSPTLMEAARQVPSGLAGFSDFASAYLRHPRAFLGAKHLAEHPRLELEDDSTERLTVKDTELHIADWLSVVLPRSVQQDRFERLPEGGHLLDTSVKMSFRKPLAEEIEKAWEGDDSTGGGLHTISDFPKGPIKTFEQALRRHADRMNAQAAQLWRSDWATDIRKVVGELSNPDPALSIIDLLRRRELASIEALYAKTDVVGAVQLLEPSERMRGLPALRFDAEYLDAQQQCDELCGQLFRPDRPAQFDLSAMEKALRGTDPSGYHARVLKAYVFACAGLWFQVRPLCRSALLAVDSIPNKKADDNRRGREAAYLLAVAERRLASSYAGVEHAEAALNEAVRRNHLPRDLRFDCERLAQQVTRIQLDRYSKKATPGESLVVLIERSMDLARQALEETPSVVKRWVVRQSVTNGLLLSLIAKEPLVRPAQVSGHARELIHLLSREAQAPDLRVSPFDQTQQKYADAISDLVWLVAVAVFGERKEQRDAAKAALVEDTARQQHSSSPITFIERVRQGHLLALAGVEAEK